MFNFKPLKLLADGQYPFVIKDCKHTKSKTSGNDMLSFQVLVTDESGYDHLLFDNILSGYAGMMEKLKVLCDAKGLQVQYDNGEIEPEQLIGAKGLAIVKTQESKNVIIKYIKGQTDVSPANDFHDDQLPF